MIGAKDNEHKVAKMNFILKNAMEYNMFRFITGSK